MNKILIKLQTEVFHTFTVTMWNVGISLQTKEYYFVYSVNDTHRGLEKCVIPIAYTLWQDRIFYHVTQSKVGEGC